MKREIIYAMIVRGRWKMVREILFRTVNRKMVWVKKYDRLSEKEIGKIKKFIVDYLRQRNGKAIVNFLTFRRTIISKLGFYVTCWDLKRVINELKKDGILEIRNFGQKTKEILLRGVKNENKEG